MSEAITTSLSRFLFYLYFIFPCTDSRRMQSKDRRIKITKCLFPNFLVFVFLVPTVTIFNLQGWWSLITSCIPVRSTRVGEKAPCFVVSCARSTYLVCRVVYILEIGLISRRIHHRASTAPAMRYTALELRLSINRNPDPSVVAVSFRSPPLSGHTKAPKTWMSCSRSALGR